MVTAVDFGMTAAHSALKRKGREGLAKNAKKGAARSSCYIGPEAMSWWSKKKPAEPAKAVEDRIRRRYQSFRDLLSLNNECLELMAAIQEDLQFVLPRRDIVGPRISGVYSKAEATVAALERLTGINFPQLHEAIHAQQNEVERYIAARQELVAPNFSAWLGEIDGASTAEAGGKAAALAEVKNQIGLPVPDGYVITAEAYRQFCGIPLWERSAMPPIIST